MMPSPTVIDVALICAAAMPSATIAWYVFPSAAGTKIALSLAASSVFACAAMRSITVRRSSVDDRSRPTSESADDSRAPRCVSARRRAFSSATPIDAAIVDSRWTWASSNACSRSKLSIEIAATSRLPTITGTKTHARLGSVPGTVLMPRASIAARSPITTGRPAFSALFMGFSGSYGCTGVFASRCPCS